MRRGRSHLQRKSSQTFARPSTRSTSRASGASPSHAAWYSTLTVPAQLRTADGGAAGSLIRKRFECMLMRQRDDSVPGARSARVRRPFRATSRSCPRSDRCAPCAWAVRVSAFEVNARSRSAPIIGILPLSASRLDQREAMGERARTGAHLPWHVLLKYVHVFSTWTL